MLRTIMAASLLAGTVLLTGCPSTSNNNPGNTTVVFRDDFDSGFAAGWTVTRPDNSKLSTTARTGFIRLITGPGTLADETLPNVVTRTVSNDFILDTYLEFAPDQNNQFAGLLVQASDDSGAVVYGITQGTNGRGVVALGGLNNSSSTNSVASFSGSAVFLRLERSGDTYSFTYSTDGTNFSALSTNGSKVSVALGADVKVGFITTNGNCTDNCDTATNADFDFFQISVRS